MLHPQSNLLVVIFILKYLVNTGMFRPFPSRPETLYPPRSHPEERKQYYDTLNSQVQNRETVKTTSRKNDEEEQLRHFQVYENIFRTTKLKY